MARSTLTGTALALALAAGCDRSAHSPAAALSDADRTAIHALDTAFVRAWIRDDTAAVLGLFRPDAILFPPNSPPVEGLAAIRAFWWPTDGSHTRITSFTRDVVEIAGTPALAYFRGAATLGWVYTKDGKESAQTSRSTDLTLVVRDSSGAWRISRQMWTQLTRP